IVTRAVAEGKNPTGHTVESVMTRSVVTVRADAPLDEVVATMERHQIRRVPVVDEGGCCTGIISQADLALEAPPQKAAELVRVVKQYGPKALVVTGGAGAAETADVFRVGGLMTVVDEEGATFVDHNRPPFVSVDLDYAAGGDVRGPQQSIMVNRRVLEYETLI